MSKLIPFSRLGNRLVKDGTTDLDHLSDNFFNMIHSWEKGNKKSNFKLDISETDKEYLVEVDLPGIKKEEVSLNIEDEYLTISIKQKEEKNVEKKNYVHKERKSFQSSRSIYLAGIDIEHIDAKMDSGVLIIKLPKNETVESKKAIKIK